ncbi:MAG TPA: cupredoxin family copper-binding protein [Steroidobacteraceae bacterium]
MRTGAWVALALSWTVAVAFADTHAPQTYTVTIENMQFTPKTLSVHRRDRVVWVNKDLFPHTATAEAKAFDSHEIAAGASWTYVAGKAGEYAYGCSLHPTMQGKLLVR